MQIGDCIFQMRRVAFWHIALSWAKNKLAQTGKCNLIIAKIIGGMMLVHIVNASNASFYADYLDQMIKVRSHSVFDDADDELDFVEGVEFLLVFTKCGRLIEQKRFVPTYKTKCLSKTLAPLVTEEIEFGPEVWENTRFTSPNAADTLSFEKSNAYVHIGSLEWALTKGIKRIIGVGRKPYLERAEKEKWPVRQVGPLFEYGDGKFAAPIEVRASKNILDTSRMYFGINQTVTYTAPPPLDHRTITAEQIRFLDAALRANEEFEQAHYSA